MAHEVRRSARRGWHLQWLWTLLFLPLSSVIVSAEPPSDASGPGAQGLPASGSVVGTVVDASGGVIQGARATLRTSPARAALTDRAGRFEFAHVPPGVHPLTVEAAGFSAALAQVRPGVPQELLLHPAPVSETVEVNTGTLDQIRLDEPSPTSGLTRDDIATRNNRRLSDVVARMPGAFLTGPPGGDKDLRLRGLDKEFSRAQIDGLTVPDGGEKRELQLNRIPSSAIDTVRIIRNPTAEYESDGLAGRVDVITRGVPDAFSLDGRVGTGARNSMENGITQGQLAAGRRWSRGLGLFGVLDYLDDTLPIGRQKALSSGNLETEDQQQRQRSLSFFGDLAWFSRRMGEFHVRPTLLRFDTDMAKLKGSRSGEGRGLTREEESEDKLQDGRGVRLSHRFTGASGLALDSQAAWFRSSEDKDKTKLAYRVEKDTFAPDKRTLEAESKADSTWSLATTASLPMRWPIWSDVKVGASLRLRDRHRDKDRVEVSAAGASRDTSEPKDRYGIGEDHVAFFVQDRLRFTERLSLTVGVRHERVRLESWTPAATAEPRTFVDVNPSAHLLYRATEKLTLRAAASRGLSRPKFDELSPYENISSTKIVMGNPDLEPSRAWSFDAGFDFATRSTTFSVNAFHKTLTGVIEEVDTGADRDGRDVYQVLNVGDGWIRGLELEQRYRVPSSAPRWARAFSFWANETLLSSELRQASGLRRPFKEQPKWIANVGLDLNDDRLGTSLSVMTNLLSRRHEYKPNGDVKTWGASTVVDVALYQRLRGQWRLFVEANNLTNRARVIDEGFVSGASSRQLESYGRTLLLGIQVGVGGAARRRVS